MAFDPDAYLKEKESAGGFDPDAYLKEKEPDFFGKVSQQVRDIATAPTWQEKTRGVTDVLNRELVAGTIGGLADLPGVAANLALKYNPITLGAQSAYQLATGKTAPEVYQFPASPIGKQAIESGMKKTGLISETRRPELEQTVGLGLAATPLVGPAVRGVASTAASAARVPRDVLKGAFINRPGTPSSALNPIGEYLYTPAAIDRYNKGYVTLAELEKNPAYRMTPEQAFPGAVNQAALKMGGDQVPGAGRVAESFGERVAKDYFGSGSGGWLNAAADIMPAVLSGGAFPVPLNAARRGIQALADYKLARTGNLDPTFVQRAAAERAANAGLPSNQYSNMFAGGGGAAGPAMPASQIAAAPQQIAPMAEIPTLTQRAPQQIAPMAEIPTLTQRAPQQPPALLGYDRTAGQPPIYVSPEGVAGTNIRAVNQAGAEQKYPIQPVAPAVDQVRALAAQQALKGPITQAAPTAPRVKPVAPTALPPPPLPPAAPRVESVAPTALPLPPIAAPVNTPVSKGTEMTRSTPRESRITFDDLVKDVEGAEEFGYTFNVKDKIITQKPGGSAYDTSSGSVDFQFNMPGNVTKMLPKKLEWEKSDQHWTPDGTNMAYEIVYSKPLKNTPDYKYVFVEDELATKTMNGPSEGLYQLNNNKWEKTNLPLPLPKIDKKTGNMDYGKQPKNIAEMIIAENLKNKTASFDIEYKKGQTLISERYFNKDATFNLDPTLKINRFVTNKTKDFTEAYGKNDLGESIKFEIPLKGTIKVYKIEGKKETLYKTFEQDVQELKKGKK